MSTVKVNDKLRQHVELVKPLMNVPEHGGTINVDADFISRTLPQNLTQQNLRDSVDYLSQSAEAIEVAIGELCAPLAKGDAEFTEASVRIPFHDRLSLSTKWHRDHPGVQEYDEDGKAKPVTSRRGVVVSAYHLTTSDEHQETQRDLEKLADVLLG